MIRKYVNRQEETKQIEPKKKQYKKLKIVVGDLFSYTYYEIDKLKITKQI